MVASGGLQHRPGGRATWGGSAGNLSTEVVHHDGGVLQQADADALLRHPALAQGLVALHGHPAAQGLPRHRAHLGACKHAQQPSARRLLHGQHTPRIAEIKATSDIVTYAPALQQCWRGHRRRLTCADPGLGAGAVDGDAGVQDLHGLHHQAVRDGAEELWRGRRRPCQGPPPGALLPHLLLLHLSLPSPAAVHRCSGPISSCRDCRLWGVQTTPVHRIRNAESHAQRRRSLT